MSIRLPFLVLLSVLAWSCAQAETGRKADAVDAVPVSGLSVWQTSDPDALPPFPLAADHHFEGNFIELPTTEGELFYWVRLEFPAEMRLSGRYHLIADNPMVGEVRLFAQLGDSLLFLYAAGDELPFAVRPVLRRTFVFPLGFEGDENAVHWCRVSNSGRQVYLPFYLMRPDAYEMKEQGVMAYSTVMMGIMLCIALTAFVMFFFLRAGSLLVLSGLVLSFTVFTAVAGGIGFMLLIPEHPGLYNRLQHGSIYFCMFFMLLYAFSYLRGMMESRGWLLLAFHAQLGAVLVMAIGATLSIALLNIFAPFIYGMVLWVLLQCLIAGTLTVMRNLHEARYYLVALAVGIFASTLYYLNILSPVSYDNVTTGSVMLASTAGFMFLLLMAEMERIRVIRRKREEALKELEVLYEERRQRAASLEVEVVTTQRELEREKKLAGMAVLRGEEQERRRIAQELHDGIGSLLTVLRLHLDMLASGGKTDDPQFTRTLDNSNRLLDTAYQELKGISERVLPTVLQHFGLQRALEDLAAQVNSSGKCRLTITFDGQQLKLAETTEHAVYRIVLEIVTNILKHADATKATVAIAQQNGHILITGKDDGRGFDISAQRNGSGISNIRNRAVSLGGTFDIISELGKGTEVRVMVPRE